ncbi:hypothetical protein DVH24_031981 [Malus domestica]|uniref:Uncharacterized protein n=1 Tax=Malus domestica TaxID=3750 RepID=A0A498J5W2_MALDO|nr:hypothetical protein DVH24_031981 [Malus domestica]
MDVGTSANSPRISAGTREDSGPHKCIFFLLTMLGLLLQVKCAALQVSPFDTNYVIVLMLIADLFAYAGTLAVVKILQASHNSNLYELMNKISLLCGTFALILLTFLLIPDFGWFALACWVICFVITMVKSYPTLKRLCISTTNAADMLHYVIHKLKELNMRLNGGLLGVKHATGDLRSPFVTDHKTVVMFIVDLFAYAGALATAKILQTSNHTNIYERMNNINLLCGTLAAILLALLLDPDFGRFTLAFQAPPNSDLAESIMNKISLLVGTLVLILELVLVSGLGP